MSGGVWLRRLCAALMEDRWEGRQDGGGENPPCCLLFWREIGLAFTGSFPGYGFGCLSLLFCSVYFICIEKECVSVKLYQISQSGGLGQSARLFDFNVFMIWT